MAVPRKKRSIAKKHQRYSSWATKKMKKMTNKMSLVVCDNCKKFKKSHHVCQHCGYYKGRQVLTIKVKKGKTVLEA